MGFFDWLAAQLVQSPDPSFLTDLLGIVTVLLGIVVPLTFSVVAKISEEFQSPMILKDFGRRLPVKAFFRLLIFDAVLLILLKFFVSDTPHTDYWIGLAWFSLVLSLVTFGLGAVFFKLAWQYSSDTEFLLNRFVSNAKKVL